MASSQDLMTIAHNTTFQERVRYYCVKEANAVMVEVNTTPSHSVRVTYAKAILNQVAPTTIFFNLLEYTVGVLTNPTIASEATLGSSDFGVPDSDMEFAVNSIYNAYAGVAT